MSFAKEIEALDRVTPVAAEMATEDLNLISFARKAGKNLFSVIPDATRHELYLRGPGNLHYVCDPEMITEVLIGVGRHFPKSQFTKNVIGDAVGNGMILSEGDKWKAQRRRYSPLFAARNLPHLSKEFAQTGLDTAATLLANPGQTDVCLTSQQATLTDISRVMFSGNEAVAPETVRDALWRFTNHISFVSLFDLMGLPTWVPRKKWLRGKEPVNYVRSLASDVIASRRAKMKDNPEDFLDLMIAALDEDFEDLDTTIDNLLTFVVAGYETAAVTMSWGLYLLALHPAIQSTLREEVRAACPSGPIPFDAVAMMPRLHAHIRETLRLFPAAALFARDATQDVVIKDVHFKKGDAIMFPIWSLHRHTKLWDNAGEYVPERFLDWKAPRGQFLPFGDGPRVCIGAQYAETEIMILMASMIRDVEFSMTDHEIPLPNLTFTMRPGGPIMLDVRPAL